MSDSPSTEIWRDRRAIENARREKVLEAMAEYDKTIHYPALAELMKRCAAIGHVRGNWHQNGLGWSWFYCIKCGGRMEIVGPDGIESEITE